MNPYDFRSPEEKAEDEARQVHENGDCDGAPYCWYCQDIEEREEELEREEITKKVNARTLEILDIFRASFGKK